MSEPAKRLWAINGELDHETGELVEHDEREDQIQTLQNRVRGLDSTVKEWKRRCANLEGVDPDSREVRAVLDYWADRVLQEGWWSKRPVFRPGHERWGPPKARLKEGDPYTVEYLQTVVDGALMQDKRKTNRAWLDASSIFGQKVIEWHYERAMDPGARRVTSWMELAKHFRGADPAWLAERCDCTHARIGHTKCVFPEDSPFFAYSPCQVAGCDCPDFSDIGQRADEWIAERKRDVARGRPVSAAAAAALRLEDAA